MKRIGIAIGTSMGVVCVGLQLLLGYLHFDHLLISFFYCYFNSMILPIIIYKFMFDKNVSLDSASKIAFTSLGTMLGLYLILMHFKGVGEMGLIIGGMLFLFLFGIIFIAIFANILTRMNFLTKEDSADLDKEYLDWKEQDPNEK